MPQLLLVTEQGCSRTTRLGARSIEFGERLADNHCASGRISLGAPCSEQRARYLLCRVHAFVIRPLDRSMGSRGRGSRSARRLLFPRSLLVWLARGEAGRARRRHPTCPLGLRFAVGGFWGDGRPSRQSVPRVLVGCGDGWGASVGCAVLGCFGGLRECWSAGWRHGQMDRWMDVQGGSCERSG